MTRTPLAILVAFLALAGPATAEAQQLYPVRKEVRRALAVAADTSFLTDSLVSGASGTQASVFKAEISVVTTAASLMLVIDPDGSGPLSAYDPVNVSEDGADLQPGRKYVRTWDGFKGESYQLQMSEATTIHISIVELAGAVSVAGGRPSSSSSGGSGDLTAVTVTGDALVVTSGTGPVPDLSAHAHVEALADAVHTADYLWMATGSTWAAAAPSAVRTALSLVVGTNVQAFNSNLTTLTTSTQGDILYSSAANTLAKLGAGTSGLYLKTQGAGANPVWASVGVFIALDPINGVQPSSGTFPDWTVRNNHLVLQFDDGTAVTTDDILWEGLAMPSTYDSAGTLTVTVKWIAATATSGDVVWGAKFEALAGTDLDADSFAAAQTATGTANGTSGILTSTAITFTQSQADAIAAGGAFRLFLYRDSDAGGDTMTGDAQVLSVTISE